MVSSSQQRCTWTGWIEKSIFILPSHSSIRTVAGKNYFTINWSVEISLKKISNSIGSCHIYTYIFRYITTEELEQALREYGMHDGRDIKEIISEVDGDNVSSKKGIEIDLVVVKVLQLCP
jgi:hypothetical protein